MRLNGGNMRSKSLKDKMDEIAIYKKLITEKIGCEMSTLCLEELNCLAINLKFELYVSEHNWK